MKPSPWGVNFHVNCRCEPPRRPPKRGDVTIIGLGGIDFQWEIYKARFFPFWETGDPYEECETCREIVRGDHATG